MTKSTKRSDVTADKHPTVEADEMVPRIELTPEEQQVLDEKIAWWREWEENRSAKVKKMRHDAQANYKAMDGWRRVTTDEEWQEVYDKSLVDYKSGAFLLEQLGAERYLDPSQFATLLVLRQAMIDEMQVESPAEYMLLDLAIIAYRQALRVNGWIGDLALTIEREFFNDRGPTARLRGDGTRFRGLTVELELERMREMMLPMLDRCNRMFIRNLRAIQELRRGPAPNVNIGAAGRVNVAQQQVNAKR